MSLKAPFPWFGGKSRVAHLAWERFGVVPNYVEPFAGSLAVLLGRPSDARPRRSTTGTPTWRTSGGPCSTDHERKAKEHGALSAELTADLTKAGWLDKRLDVRRPGRYGMPNATWGLRRLPAPEQQSLFGAGA